MVIFKVVANEDTMLRTQMFPRLPVRATFVADTNFVSVSDTKFVSAACTQKKCFVSRSFSYPRNIMSNNVSATLCPRLPPPLATCFQRDILSRLSRENEIKIYLFVNYFCGNDRVFIFTVQSLILYKYSPGILHFLELY